MHQSTSALTNEALGIKPCSNVEKNLSNKKILQNNMMPKKCSSARKNSVFTIDKLCPKEIKRRLGFEDSF